VLPENRESSGLLPILKQVSALLLLNGAHSWPSGRAGCITQVDMIGFLRSAALFRGGIA